MPLVSEPHDYDTRPEADWLLPIRHAARAFYVHDVPSCCDSVAINWVRLHWVTDSVAARPARADNRCRPVGCGFGLPVAVADYLVDGEAVGLDDWLEGAVGRVAEVN